MADYYIIGGDQKEYGPSTAEELGKWIAEGRLNGQSKTRLNGTTEWKTLEAFPELARYLRPPELLGGTSAPPVENARSWVEQINAQQPSVEIGKCLASSWKLLLENFGLLFGASFLVWLLTSVLQFVPGIGGILSMFFKGVLHAGLYMVILNRIRGRSAVVGDIFVGFSLALGQLALTSFLTSFLSSSAGACCLVLPGLYLMVAWTFSIPLVVDKRLEFWTAMETSRKVLTRVWFAMFGLILIAYLPVVVATAFMDVKLFSEMLPFIQKVMNSGTTDPTQFMQMGMQLAGKSMGLIIMTKVVMLVNLPFAAGALMYAYENI